MIRPAYAASTGRTSWLQLERLLPVALVGAWLVVLALVALRIDQGWIPHDEGAFAQSAERVLHGQLPHRDFSELYTGGLTFLNAGVFAALGHDLLWLRLPMFILFAGFVPTVYWIARRFVDRGTAVATTAVAVAWGLPAYPAPVPSWYQLMLATFGAACVLRFIDEQSHRWLVLAGLLGGLSVTFKIVGLYYVAAVLVALVFIEQRSRPVAPPRKPQAADLIAAGIAPVAFLAAFLTVRPRLGQSETVNFLIPIGAICGVVLLEEWRTAGTLSLPTRLRRQLNLAGPFLLGVAAPIAVLVAVYASAGAVGALLHGVLVEPRSRLGYAYLSTPGVAGILRALPLLLWIGARRRASRRMRDVGDTVVLALLAFLVLTAHVPASYLALWNLGRALAPIVIVVGAFIVARQRSASIMPETGGAFLLLALGAFVSLVQFPYGAPVYYLYVAPLIALAGASLFRLARSSSGLLLPGLLSLLALYGFLYVDRSSLHSLGGSYRPDSATTEFDVSRASIRVSAADRAEYLRAITLLHDHAHGRWIFAGPDTPELYYLAGLDNPTRSLFDFLDSDHTGRGTNLLRTLRRRSVDVVAINVHPELSDPLDAWTLRRLRALYPNSEHTEHFEIRWR